MSATACDPSEFTTGVRVGDKDKRWLVPANDDGPPSVSKALTDTKTVILVDSRDLEPSTQSPFKFTVDLQELGVNVRNASTVELKSLVFPKVSGNNWVGLAIRQVNNGAVLHTSGDAPFATVMFPLPNAAPGTLEVMKGHDFVHNAGSFSPPLRALTRLDCSFTQHEGALLTAADTGGITEFQFILELGGRIVGVSQALQSSVLDDTHHVEQSYRS